MLTPRATEFLSGFTGAPYPARLTEAYDILECFSHNERSETLLVRAKAEGRLCVAKVGAEQAEIRPNILSLAHPGLPEVVEAYEENGQAVLVRAYVTGESARSALKNGPLPRKRALDIGLALCDILAYLHAQQPPIIHRDIKPGNLILDGDKVYLIDFGIARSFSSDASEDTVCFGTRDYAPPEQYGFSQTDPRADIYAFGATLYTLLTGRTDATRTGQALRDRALWRIIRRCTAFAPQDRYKNIRRVKLALGGVRHRVRRVLQIVVGALLLAGGLTAAVLGSGGGLESLLPDTARFADPLVQRAVCAALGKAEGARVTKGELADVKELYLWRDECPPDEQSFESAKEAWYDTPRSLGTLSTLEDIRMLPALSALWLGAEPDVDLSPLAGAESLTELHLQFMNLSDISVVATLPNLQKLDLAGSQAADLGPIHDCHALTRLALHGVPCDDFSFLQGLDNFDYVGVSGSNTEAFLMYFREKSTNHLNVGEAPFTHMEWLTSVRNLTVLELYNASLDDITGIDGLLHLTRLNLAGNPNLTNLEPLLGIRTLEELTLSRDMQKAAEHIAPAASFTIQYRD